MRACGEFSMRLTTVEEKSNDEEDQVLSLRTHARR
jgi:hypothetical protein